MQAVEGGTDATRALGRGAISAFCVAHPSAARGADHNRTVMPADGGRVGGGAAALRRCAVPGDWAAIGGGGATSCSAPGANWLTCTISGGSLTLGAATGQTSHQVIGTCGSATSFAPCSLVAGDLPSIPLATGVTGTLPAANLPTPTASTLGGIESITSASHNWVAYIDTSGAPHQSQPACGDLSNAANSCSTDATNASNITAGTLPAAQLPTPTASTLGGIESLASASHKWINAISTAGVPAATQPACGDLSNAATSCSTDATNASNISSGTLGAGRLPAPAGGGPPGGVAAIPSVTSGINTPETTIVSYTVPANTIAAGTTYRVVAYGTCTSSAANVSTVKIRFGSTGTASDTALATLNVTSATSGSNVAFSVEFYITFQSTTTAEVTAILHNNGSTGIYTALQIIMAPANTTGLTTTSNEVLQLSYASAASTTTSTFQTATIELLKP